MFNGYESLGSNRFRGGNCTEALHRRDSFMQMFTLVGILCLKLFKCDQSADCALPEQRTKEEDLIKLGDVAARRALLKPSFFIWAKTLPNNLNKLHKFMQMGSFRWRHSTSSPLVRPRSHFDSHFTVFIIHQVDQGNLIRKRRKIN